MLILSEWFEEIKRIVQGIDDERDVISKSNSDEGGGGQSQSEAK